MRLDIDADSSTTRDGDCRRPSAMRDIEIEVPWCASAQKRASMCIRSDFERLRCKASFFSQSPAECRTGRHKCRPSCLVEKSTGTGTLFHRQQTPVMIARHQGKANQQHLGAATCTRLKSQPGHALPPLVARLPDAVVRVSSAPTDRTAHMAGAGTAYVYDAPISHDAQNSALRIGPRPTRPNAVLT